MARRARTATEKAVADMKMADWQADQRLADLRFLSEAPPEWQQVMAESGNVRMFRGRYEQGMPPRPTRQERLVLARDIAAILRVGLDRAERGVKP